METLLRMKTVVDLNIQAISHGLLSMEMSFATPYFFGRLGAWWTYHVCLADNQSREMVSLSYMDAKQETVNYSI